MSEIEQDLLRKYNRLKKTLSEMGPVLVAYSGGVDSSLLLKTAAGVLKGRVLAVTARSPIHPGEERLQAVHGARKFGVPLEVVDFEGWKDPDFIKNSPQRCYICKKNLFRQLKNLASSRGIPHILDGENADDQDDFRPGAAAARELGIRSPLKESGLTKQNIRELSRILDLDTWNKPSQACLASRFPYGRPIDEKELNQIEAAEKFIKDMGFSQVRVRHHGRLARIEIIPPEFPLLLKDDIKDKVADGLKNIGFTWVSLDLTGYRTGSMNEALEKT
ncbi:MAG: ATP-dependent sacrificial sulfur transferase LarE [Candidatus Aminicenantes bacterium]